MSIKYGSNRFMPRPVGGGDSLWQLYGANVVGLVNLANKVAIGASSMLSDEELRVAGGIAATPTVAGNDAFVQVGSGDALALSGANSFRLIYNAGTAQAEISTNGGAYVAIGGGGASPWTSAAGVITEVVPADLVVIGSAAALTADQFQVLGNSMLRAAVDSTATFAVQDSATNTKFQVDTVNNAAISTGSFQMSSGLTAEVYLESGPSTAAVAGAGAGRIRYNNAGTPSWQGSVNGGAYSDFITASTLPTAGFVQNGNSFGADAVLGTNDAFALQFETGGTTRGRFLSSGELIVGAAVAVINQARLYLDSTYTAGFGGTKGAFRSSTTVSTNNDTGAVWSAYENIATSGTINVNILGGTLTFVSHSTTGTASSLFGMWVTAGPAAVATVGLIGNVYGIRATHGHDGNTITSPITNSTGLDVQAYGNTTATNTIGTNRGVVINNHGATGVTNAVGIDVLAQSGAATQNIGIRTQSPVVIGTTNISNSESLRLTKSFTSGGAATKHASYIQSTITTNTDTGLVSGLRVEQEATTSVNQMASVSIDAGFSSTGTASSVWGIRLFARGLSVGALGTINNLYGIEISHGYSALPASGLITTAQGVRINSVGTSAARTITNNTGLSVTNHGNTGVTNAYGIDIDAQSGAASVNIGLRVQGNAVVGGPGMFGAEALRVTGSGFRSDGTSHVVLASSTLSINNSGGPINIGDLANAQAINIGTGAAARAINIGNTTTTSSIANSFGTNGFGLIQSAASSGTPVGVLLTAGLHTGLANAEATDVNFNLARTVTFSGGGAAIATQRAYRVQAPTYAAASAQTINRAATVEIAGAPVQGANVTFSAVSAAGNGTYALNVATGAARFGGDVYIRDTATGPGVNGLTSTDSSNNGFRVYQLNANQTFWTNVGSTNTLIFQCAVAIQGTVLNPFSDGGIDLGGPSNRWRDLYCVRTNVKTHAAYTGSFTITTTGAGQTTTGTPLAIFTSPALLDNSSYWVEAWVTARDTAGGQRALYLRQACVYRQGGGAATLLGGTPLAPVTVEPVAGWDADITVTGNTFTVTVTGAAATTLNWVCTVRYQGVSGVA